jgi:hypothetical protein
MSAEFASDGRTLRLLTLAALAAGMMATASYALGITIGLRYLRPAAGTWWDARQFRVMVGAATALGLLTGLRLGGRLIAGGSSRSAPGAPALILALLAFAPLTHIGSRLARLGWGAQSAAIESRLVGVFGYDRGRNLDKVLIAGVYFLKTTAFALMTGLALVALAIAAVSLFELDDRNAAGSRGDGVSGV